MQQILEMIKVNLRIDTSAFDEAEVLVLINACSLDLINAGVSPEKAKDYDDPLIMRAIVLYCKANFGFDANFERYAKAYKAHKNSLALAGDYSV